MAERDSAVIAVTSRSVSSLVVMSSLEENAMLDHEALRQVGKLIADCDRRMLQYAVTEEYLDALARAAATAVEGAAARAARKTA